MNWAETARIADFGFEPGVVLATFSATFRVSDF
jgi:hypothetical protein